MPKTVSAKKEDITKQWYLVDAADRILGRVAGEVAHSHGETQGRLDAQR